jgi:hypothetical protein
VDLQFISVQRELQKLVDEKQKLVDEKQRLVEEKQRQLVEEKDEEAAKLELLDNKMRQTAQQLEVLKELFARLMVNV